MQSLNPGQDQHLLNMLSSHLTVAKTSIESDTSTDQVSGTCLSIYESVLFNPKY